MSTGSVFKRFFSLFSSNRGADVRQEGPDAKKERLERLFGYRIRNTILIEQAFCHASYPTSGGDNGVSSNERLEFLGDAVLDLIVRELLYEKYPVKDEGALTKMRSILASRSVLAQKAREAELGEFILLSPGEEKTGGRKKDSILANTLEAVIGAMYLDGGLEAARNFVLRLFGDNWEELSQEAKRRNYKGELLEYCQKMFKKAPGYHITRQEGAEHRRRYTIEVRLRGRKLGIGRGYSKKQAEQRAAEQALINLEKDFEPEKEE